MAKIKTFKGDTLSMTFTVTDQDDEVVDLTGATVTFNVISSNGSTLISEEVTSHTTPLSGVTDVVVSKVIMASVPVDVYAYTLNVELSGAAEYVAEKGWLEVGERY